VGVTSVKLPPQSPNLNAYAERFVRSIKESCLDRLILFGEASLRKAIRDFILHYHEERNHRAKAISFCFLERNCPTPRRTGRFAVSSGSAGCSSTIIEKRHEDRPGADPVGWLLRGWIALRSGHDSEAHQGDALVLVAGSASPLGGGWVTTSYM
jgi:hypothetical protein